MKITQNDKFIAYLTLLSGLTISAVAIYYSVAGLTAIFAAAVIPIIVMGVALEISKLAATVWLKQNWKRAPNFIRGYLLSAIAILMLITSMGIFGFLSKAHSDQSLVSGDVQSKIAIYDEKIKTAKENIEANRKQLKQMDEAVDQVMARSTDEKGADKSNAIRRAQQRDRVALAKDIEANQKLIASLNDEAAPIRAEVRKVEAEVGPIKYIANLIYGDNPDANVLEKAVTWVILIIVSVFDPLAVILLLASQYSFQWFRQDKEQEEGDSPLEPDPVVDSQPLTVTESTEDDIPVAESNLPDVVETATVTQFNDINEIPSVDTGWKISNDNNIIEYTVANTEVDIPVLENEEMWTQRVIDESDEDDLPQVASAKAAWKLDNPNDTIKHQRKLFDDGHIKALPWELPPYTAQENADTVAEIERPGDYLTETEKTVWLEKDGNVQTKKEIGSYQQNAEQGQNTIWQQIQAKKQ